MVEFFLDFSQKKVENTKIHAKIYNLLATGRKASGQCLFQGWGLSVTCPRELRGLQVPSPPRNLHLRDGAGWGLS